MDYGQNHCSQLYSGLKIEVLSTSIGPATTTAPTTITRGSITVRLVTTKASVDPVNSAPNDACQFVHSYLIFH